MRFISKPSSSESGIPSIAVLSSLGEDASSPAPVLLFCWVFAKHRRNNSWDFFTQQDASSGGPSGISCKVWGETFNEYITTSFASILFRLEDSSSQVLSFLLSVSSASLWTQPHAIPFEYCKKYDDPSSHMTRPRVFSSAAEPMIPCPMENTSDAY